MYPVIRMLNEFRRFRRAPRLGPFDTHVSHHRCWPHDLDIWWELNNGRTLTLYDLGRLVLFQRIGFIPVMRAERWRGTVAGSAVRYRRRIQLWERIEMHSRLLGWDERFFYFDQSMWTGAGCAGQVLLRTAVTAGRGIVPAADVARAMGLDPASPPLAVWVRAWIAAEAERPWPPQD